MLVLAQVLAQVALAWRRARRAPRVGRGRFRLAVGPLLVASGAGLHIVAERLLQLELVQVLNAARRAKRQLAIALAQLQRIVGDRIVAARLFCKAHLLLLLLLHSWRP